MRHSASCFKLRHLGVSLHGSGCYPAGRMPSFSRHVFVCINERAADNPKGSCMHKGGVDVRDRLKAELSARGLSKMIRANNAGCLDACEHGVAVVVYPEQVWYGNVTPEDVPEIVEQHLIGGQVVTRLLIADQPQAAAPSQLATIRIPGK